MNLHRQVEPGSLRDSHFASLSLVPDLFLYLGTGRTLPPADPAFPSHLGILWPRVPPTEQTAERPSLLLPDPHTPPISVEPPEVTVREAGAAG